MNMTSLRETRFDEYVKGVITNHSLVSSMALADQDVLNYLYSGDVVLGSIHEIDCRWNYR